MLNDKLKVASDKLTGKLDESIAGVKNALKALDQEFNVTINNQLSVNLYFQNTKLLNTND